MSNEVLETLQEMRQEQKQIALLGAKEVLTTEEVALYTGFAKAYIYKLVCYKQIPYYKNPGGKLTFFKKSEINEWLCSHKVKTKDELASEAAAYVVKNPIKKGCRR